MSNTQSNNSGAYVSVGASVPFAAAAALDEMAERRGLTRSAMLRAVIDRGLIEIMASDPDIRARYQALVPVPASSRSRRRARIFNLDLDQAVGGE
jgi:hypothetical protein